MTSSDWASTIYAYTFVSGALITTVWYAFRHGVNTLIETHISQIRDEMKTELMPLQELKRNGGSSIKDKVNKIDGIEDRVDRIESRVDQIYAFLMAGSK